jgi:hypothetical protein
MGLGRPRRARMDLRTRPIVHTLTREWPSRSITIVSNSRVHVLRMKPCIRGVPSSNSRTPCRNASSTTCGPLDARPSEEALAATLAEARDHPVHVRPSHVLPRSDLRYRPPASEAAHNQRTRQERRIPQPTRPPNERSRSRSTKAYSPHVGPFSVMSVNTTIRCGPTPVQPYARVIPNRDRSFIDLPVREAIQCRARSASGVVRRADAMWGIVEVSRAAAGVDGADNARLAGGKVNNPLRGRSAPLRGTPGKERPRQAERGGPLLAHRLDLPPPPDRRRSPDRARLGAGRAP